jgi:dipeptidyl aminopeptidase/acylaminoacyl peptidase
MLRPKHGRNVTAVVVGHGFTNHVRKPFVALRVRMAQPTEVVPPSPVEVVDRIAPTPVLLVHGTEDHYVPVDHALGLLHTNTRERLAV